MKQVININFQGSVVPIEQSAYEILKDYIESLKRYFANEPGRDEIVNDIESRIGELFGQRLKNGATCITDEDVAAIKSSIGTPEDFAETEGTDASQANTTAEDGATPNFVRPGKLFRNENNKILGGVCSGLAHYFNLDVSLVRIIFIIAFFLGGFSILAYLILWIVVPSSASLEIGGVRKRLFRDPDNKLIAGVASGIAQYFNINVWIPRLVFLLPLFSLMAKWGWNTDWGWTGPTFIFRSTSLIIYIILWLVLPEANSTAEKLEMKGEKVDLNSIKARVTKEINDVQSRAAHLGKLDKDFLEKGIPPNSEYVYKRSTGNAVGDVISTIVKIFLYFILGVIVIALLAGLFGLTITAIGLFPLKNYLLIGQTQNLWAWGTLIFFIIVPLIGLITWIIRRLARIKGNTAAYAITFSILWAFGWICAMGLVSSVTEEFKKESNYNIENVALVNPHVNSLEITTEKSRDIFNRRRVLRFQPWMNIDEDSAYIPNVKINIVQAKGDSFYVEKVRFSNGRDRQNADANAAKIKFAINQQDTLLFMDNGVPINTVDKFRNQQVVVNIYVPVGKRIKVDRRLNIGDMLRINSGRGGFIIESDDFDFTHNDAEEGWEQGVDYIMKSDGLYTLDGRKADQVFNDADPNWNDDNWDENNWDDNVTDSTARKQLKQLDSMRNELRDELKDRQRKSKDSLQKMKDEIEEELRRMNAKASAETDQLINDLAATVQNKKPFNPTLTVFNPIF